MAEPFPYASGPFLMVENMLDGDRQLTTARVSIWMPPTGIWRCIAPGETFEDYPKALAGAMNLAVSMRGAAIFGGGTVIGADGRRERL